MCGRALVVQLLRSAFYLDELPGASRRSAISNENLNRRVRIGRAYALRGTRPRCINTTGYVNAATGPKS